MNNLKKLLASVMALAMVASVAPVKVDAAIAAPTVCSIDNTKYINTVEDYVEELADTVDLETVKLADEFAFRGETYATVKAVLAVEYTWDGTNTTTLQAAVTEITEANCASDEVAYLAGLVKGVSDITASVEYDYNKYLDEDNGILTAKFDDEIDTKDKAIALLDKLQTLVVKYTDADTTPAIAYLGNVEEDVVDTLDAILEAAEEAMDVIVDTYDIELASAYYAALVEYLEGLDLIETTTSSITGVISKEVITIDELETWVVAGKRSGTTYELEAIITKIENDKAGLPGSYDDFEDEIADLMEGLEDLVAASETLDELVADVKDLEANTKIGKTKVDEAKSITGETYTKNTTWDEVFADADVAELANDVNFVEFEYLVEMVDLIEENFYTVTYTKKGSRWLTDVDATEYAPHMETVFAAAGVELPVLKTTDGLGLFDQYVDEDDEPTENTNWEVLVEYMVAQEEAYEAIANGVKGITVNNLTAKNVEKVVAAYEAYDVINTGNLTAAEAKKVEDAYANIGVLYFKALFGGITTEKVTGWVDLGNGDWDYYGEDGNIYTGWVAAGSDWYYVKNGHMLRNTWIAKDATGAVWYYVGNDGAMVSNTVVDGYTINANGEWVK